MQDLKNSKKDPSKDSATKTTYYCTCHAVPRKMVLIPGGYSSYYACENYLEENRLPGTEGAGPAAFSAVFRSR